MLCAFTAVSMLLAGPAAAAPLASAARAEVIVVLQDGADAREAAGRAARQHGARVQHIYEHAINGFSGSVPEGRLDALRNDPRVDYIEFDQRVEIFELSGSLPTGIDRVEAETVQGDGLTLIDGTDDAWVDARVAVIDTGVDFAHPDLNVATATSANCLHTSGGGPPWARDYVCVTGEGDDDHGHGTHVAGTVGALDDGPNVGDTHVVGVAPGAEIVAVKVLDSGGSGYESGIVAGIDYVTALNTDSSNGNDVDVANMSLGCECTMTALEDAIANSIRNGGITYAIAAGNSATDVAGYSPAGQSDSITVSALADFDGQTGGNAAPTCRTENDDTFADFSNYGQQPGDDVDAIAPGVCILSTVPGGYDTFSGTSMAAPHVAGAAALLAASGNSVSQIRSIVESSTGSWSKATDPDGDPDPLLDVSSSAYNPTTAGDGGESGGGDSTPPAAPTDLSASGGDGSVVLDWAANTETDLAGYHVYRSTTPGGEYAQVNSDVVMASAYTDTSVTNGVPYYYVVTAVDASGNESAQSNEASVTPTSSDGGDETSTLTVPSETYAQFGGSTNDRHLDVAVRITDGSAGVAGAAVTVDLYRDADATSLSTTTLTTDSAGYVTFQYRGVGPGCYTADIVDVSLSGWAWDGSDPESGSCTQ